MRAARFGQGLVLVALCIAPPASAQDPMNRDYSGFTRVREQGYPARTAAAAKDPADAPIDDGDLVIGVVVGGQARAYPIGFFWGPQTEVLNDTLGGTPIAPSWCPLSHSGAVYARKVEDKVLELGARGAERGALLLYDRESGSTWSQIQGRALKGPLAGTQLEKLPSVVTTWGRWRALHPQTTVYIDPVQPYKQWYTSSSFGRMNACTGGPPRNDDWVVGVEGPRTARAWLVRRLAATNVANDVLDDVPLVVFLFKDSATLRILRRDVAGRTLTFSAEGDNMRDAETGSLWDALTGKAVSGPLAGRALAPVSFSTALWYAWSALHPGSQVAP